MNNEKRKNKKEKSKNKKNIATDMNEKDLQQTQGKKKKQKFSKRHPIISFIIKFILLLTLIVIVVGAGIVIGVIYGMWGQDFEISEDELIIKGNSIVYDSEGNVRAELNGDENRKVIKLEDMADYLPKAYVAIEDERFYTHNGVDFKRTGAAIGSFIVHKGTSNYGGSTITQQLVKNMTDEKERTGLAGVTRKIKEWAKAFQIEKMLTKDQILELYLNIIFVGETNYGVQVGAEYYFNKDAKDLSLMECAFLAGINNAPNAYNPYGKLGYEENEKKKEKIDKRTKTVLMKMLELEMITKEEHDKACEEVDNGIKFTKGTKSSSKIYSYHIDATISKVIEDFAKEKGWTKEYASTYVYGGGLKIYSTEDPKIQEQMEKVMADNAKKYQISTKSDKDKTQKVYSQAASVVINNENGYVVGIVGGLGEKTTSRGLNRATQSTRSTGSSIKPLAELLPGIEEGLINPATRYEDYKTEFKMGTAKPYVPTNEGAYSNRAMSVREATGRSQNVPFVKMLAEITNPVSRDYLKKLGITSIDDTHDTSLSLALGGLYKGITPLEMAGAYATIENDGVYRTPILYTKVVNSQGETELEPKQETREVCSKKTAYLIKNLLVSVVKESYGTASYCSISGIDVAAKTGTTNNKKDRWLCGFTNYYTAATWYGYDTGERVNYSGTNPAGQIWSAIMKSLHKDKEKSKFEKPKGIVSVKVCKHTGLKASSKCTETYTEIFDEKHIPEVCKESGSYADVCEETGMVATEYCPTVNTQYFSDKLPKEKLELWNTFKTYAKAPTQRCTVHTAENAMLNAAAPTIDIIGGTTLNLNIGESYIEKGANAMDTIDGDITAKIQISGAVSTGTAGTYTVTYKVTNSLGKEAVATRTIIVKDPNANTTPPPPPPTATVATPTQVPTKAPEPTPTEAPVTPEPTVAPTTAPEPTAPPVEPPTEATPVEPAA